MKTRALKRKSILWNDIAVPKILSGFKGVFLLSIFVLMAGCGEGPKGKERFEDELSLSSSTENSELQEQQDSTSPQAYTGDYKFIENSNVKTRHRVVITTKELGKILDSHFTVNMVDAAVPFSSQLNFAVYGASSRLRACMTLLKNPAGCSQSKSFISLDSAGWNFEKASGVWYTQTLAFQFQPEEYIMRVWDPVSGVVSKNLVIRVRPDRDRIGMSMVVKEKFTGDTSYTFNVRTLYNWQTYSLAVFNVSKDAKICVRKADPTSSQTPWGPAHCKSLAQLGFKYTQPNDRFGYTYYLVDRSLDSSQNGVFNFQKMRQIVSDGSGKFLGPGKYVIFISTRSSVDGGTSGSSGFSVGEGFVTGGMGMLHVLN